MIILVDWYFLGLTMDMVRRGTGMLILMCELAPQTWYLRFKIKRRLEILALWPRKSYGLSGI